MSTDSESTTVSADSGEQSGARPPPQTRRGGVSTFKTLRGTNGQRVFRGDRRRAHGELTSLQGLDEVRVHGRHLWQSEGQAYRGFASLFTAHSNKPGWYKGGTEAGDGSGRGPACSAKPLCAEQPARVLKLLGLQHPVASTAPRPDGRGLSSLPSTAS